MNTDSFIWKIGTGSTLTANTGPDKDHTLSSPSGELLLGIIIVLVGAICSCCVYLNMHVCRSLLVH